MRPATFDDLPRDGAGHFRLHALAALARITADAVEALGSEEGTYERFPFLAPHVEALLARGLDLPEAASVPRWAELLRRWEPAEGVHLPLRALRTAAGLDLDALVALVALGLVEEDARFAPLLEVVQGVPGGRRPTPGFLSGTAEAPPARRRALAALRDAGVVEIANPDAPRGEWLVHVPGAVWDAIRGEAPGPIAPGLRHVPHGRLAAAEPLVATRAVHDRLARIPRLLETGEVGALVVRGPGRNGRRTLLRGVAAALGRGALEAEGLERGDDPRWRLLGPLATLLHAMPVVALDLAPGETVRVPPLAPGGAPLGFALGDAGGLAGPALERAVSLRLGVPDPGARAEHWARALDGAAGPALPEVARGFRLTSGNIRRAATLAAAQAALAGRRRVTVEDVREAARALNRQALDTLATRLDPIGGWDALVVDEDVRAELRSLEARCRCRERLGALVGAGLAGQLNAGVRALLQGPSGVGKTLAARALASALGLDLYRLDLSAIVNKYVGETEKNLSRVFAVAEELDVVLLLDEGDALLAHRTGVASSTDRYANLETNYLLQRVESFEGILLVTTNAGELIDPAFQRRMDVVVTFRPPEPEERREIWRLHLPADAAVAPPLLDEVALRCALSGGQIRNVALRAALLAAQDAGPIADGHLLAALEREYRRAGSLCPMPRPGKER